MSGRGGGTVWGRSERYLPLVAIVVSTIVFLNVLDNGFYADDYFHLYDAANDPVWKALLTPFGGHFLISYNAVFLILFNLFGLNSAAYFAVLISVHGVCIYLIFAIIQRLTRQPHLAAFGATLWGMCPVNAGSLGFISVLGHVFATAAVLGVVLDLVRLEESGQSPRPAVLARIYCLLLVAASSFGVGLGVAMGFPAIFFLWNPIPARRTQVTLLFGSLVILLPLLYFGTSSQQQPMYDSLALQIIPVALLRIVLVGLGSLLGGPLLTGEVVPLPESWVLNTAMALGALGIAGIAVGLARAKGSMRGRMLALGVLIACGYGVIATGRYWLIGNFPSPILRYHYLGAAFFSVLLCLCMSVLVAKFASLQRVGAPLYFGWLLMVIIPYNMAAEEPDTSHMFVRSQHYDARLWLDRELRNRAGKDSKEPIYLENKSFGTGPTPLDGTSYFPDMAAFYIISYAEDSSGGRPVRFFTDDEKLLETTRAEAGSRIATLLVSVEEKNEHDRKKKRPLRDQ